jgi:hypothetical protein
MRGKEKGLVWREEHDAIGILPYFDRNIYSNLAQPFWVWSTQNTTEPEFWSDLAKKPEIVIVEFNENTPYDPALDAKNPRLIEITA